MTYAPKKTAAMVLVLCAGLALALTGFSGVIIAIVMCFLVWIVGAYAVHRIYAP
ncbi:MULTISPECIES: hypothetical protein [Marivita]|uniref:Uncharacterized protein n=1 Tax=Marivita cryptomonadis TaxID=505252 RepID=A0A9Q2S113_9RHOB|nr:MULTISPECIES: hypothetical protein [Marivita]MCR9169187.1 hypothetical protein [Paracoccaceae bacterium]MBM2320939.1 hypothetical protein [Marivita cryptomonadis]MBM2330520.1 hypothetical protein [Marivita cryptomonadis]MBM2340106.1 hypothetical protein [Marivita cryptomonadis]MBM2344768.1 hypothetical protein [Marivita cryptomonadis]